jgi:2-polyprenyl-3-methyl-5-hydroxy-6-metoxy-1,4-benzoquinol methylase
LLLPIKRHYRRERFHPAIPYMKHPEIKNYYERAYTKLQEEAFPVDEARYRVWFGVLLRERRPGACLLDVGCGPGHICSLFSDLGYTVSGVDISREAIAFARRREPRGVFREAKESGELPFPDNAFDLVTCLGVLEHIPRPEMTLREMRRVCRSTGCGVWVVPNARSPYFWRGGGTGQIEETPRTLAGWRTLLGANGWEIERVFRDPGPLDRPVHGTRAHLKRFGLKLVNGLPLSFAYQFVIYARPISLS